MTPVRRILLTGAALLSFGLALVLVVQAGLPDRAQFTGHVIPGERPVAPELDAVAPAFMLSTLDGDFLNLYSLRGHPVVINFWATWCEPCRVEMPALQTIFETYQEQGLRILAVNLGESEAAVRDWVQQMGLTFDVLLDREQNTAVLYHLRGQPSTYVVSPDGIITHIFYGPLSESTLRNTLAPYLIN